jgi:hypothetical protein
MMLIDYPHSKNTNNLKVVKFKNLKNLKFIELKKKLNVFYHM